MSGLRLDEAVLIGIVMEGFFYGLYSAIFCMYMRYRASKEIGIDRNNILLYALCILYILSTVLVVIDITSYGVLNRTSNSQSRLEALGQTILAINALCEFIYQAILIYRCWVMWGRNIRVITIPSAFSLTFLATRLTTVSSFYFQGTPDEALFDALKVPAWEHTINLTSLSISLTVNAVVMFLIVLKILKVYMAARPTFKDQTSVGGAEAKLRSIIFIIIESGMAMFTIQLIRVVLTLLNIGDALLIVVFISQMFSGLIPTTIFMRVSMGLSYHDEQSMEETAASWHFAPYNQNLISETGGIEIAGQERVDGIGIQQSDDIEIVDR